MKNSIRLIILITLCCNHVTFGKNTCPEGEEFLENGPDVEGTCENPSPNVNGTKAGCFCPTGSVRNSSGICVLIENCPLPPSNETAPPIASDNSTNANETATPITSDNNSTDDIHSANDTRVIDANDANNSTPDTIIPSNDTAANETPIATPDIKEITNNTPIIHIENGTDDVKNDSSINPTDKTPTRDAIEPSKDESDKVPVVINKDVDVKNDGTNDGCYWSNIIYPCTKIWFYNCLPEYRYARQPSDYQRDDYIQCNGITYTQCPYCGCYRQCYV